MLMIRFFLFVVMFMIACNNMPNVRQNTKTVKAGLLYWRDTVLDLGEIKQGEDFVFSFYCKNKGDTTVTYKKIESTCGCTAIFNKNGKGVPPGGNDTIQAIINIQNELGPITSKIYVLSDAQREFQILKVIAYVARKN